MSSKKFIVPVDYNTVVQHEIMAENEEDAYKKAERLKEYVMLGEHKPYTSEILHEEIKEVPVADVCPKDLKEALPLLDAYASLDMLQWDAKQEGCYLEGFQWRKQACARRLKELGFDVSSDSELAELYHLSIGGKIVASRYEGDVFKKNPSLDFVGEDL